MSRMRLVLLTEALAAALLLVAAHPAGAQNTVNQTTCGGVSGVDSCLTNGFLQDLAVDCSNAHGTEVSTALAQITDRNGPNRIRLSGGNCGGFRIVGFNRLTIEGDGSPMGGFWGFIDSRQVLLKSVTFDFNVQFGFVSIQGSEVTFDGVTVKNARVGGGPPDFAVSLAESSLSFTGAPSLITNNPCVGIGVGVGSQLNVVNVTVSNNGLGQGCRISQSGIRVRDGGSVVLANQINVNGTLVDAPVDVSGNGRDGGFDVAGGSLEGHAKTGNALIRIHDNLGPGLTVLGASTAGLDGHFQFDGNNPNGQDGFAPFQLGAGLHATLALGGGVQVQGGVLGFADALVDIGEGGPMTISGGVFLSISSVAVIDGPNSIDTMTCDGTSYAYNPGNILTSGPNTCPSNGPAGITGAKGDKGDKGDQGPQGIQGPPGIPGGVAGLERVSTQVNLTLGRNTARALTATCPEGKVVIGGAAGTVDPAFAIISSVPGPNANTQWSAAFWNTAIDTRTRAARVTAICAFAQ
jgi:hypothetical protein